MKTLKLIILLVVVTVSSCTDNEAPKKPGSEFFKDNPVHIIWPENLESMEGYRADVDVFAMNSRKDTGAVQVSGYSMSMKTINGRMHTRLDMADSDTGAPLRSIVTNGEEMVLLNPQTNAAFKLPVPNQIPQELNFFGNEAMLSRVNLSHIRSEAQRLSFDVIENEGSGSLILELPSRLFPQTAGETRLTTRVVFDTANELVNHTETVSYMRDGTQVTARSYPQYQEFNGTFIKTGVIHNIDYKVPYRYPDVEGAKIYNSPDDYPIISQEEYEKLKKEGRVFSGGEMFFGDPADPSYTETIIEIYRNVEINTVHDSAFSILGGF